MSFWIFGSSGFLVGGTGHERASKRPHLRTVDRWNADWGALALMVERWLVPLIPFPSYKLCASDRPGAVKGARFARRSEPLTARTDLESYEGKGILQPSSHLPTKNPEYPDFLDKDSPDQVRFDAIKGIFLTAATERLSPRDSFLPQQYMQTCRSLSSGEVVVLKTIYEAVQQDVWKHEEKGAGKWLRAVAERSGLQHVELVEVHERRLIEKNVLTPRMYGDESGIMSNYHGRLTDFGWELCRFIVREQ